MSSERIYLSDGVYVTFDGWYWVLETGQDDGTTHRVSLNPDALVDLVRYAVRCTPALTETLARAARGTR